MNADDIELSGLTEAELLELSEYIDPDVRKHYLIIGNHEPVKKKVVSKCRAIESCLSLYNGTSDDMGHPKRGRNSQV